MSLCEVLVNFKVGSFELLSKRLPLNEFIIFTDDVSIKQRGEELGYKIEWIEEYFGFANDKIYSIYDRAISHMNVIESNTKDISYRDTNLVSGLRYDVMNRFVTLEQARQILSDKKNILFLFTNLQYQYFSIIDIAKKMGYETQFGIAEFSDSKIKKLDFSKSAAKDYDYLYQESENLFVLREQDDLLEYKSSPLFKRIKELEQQKYAFFLADNTWELYLKPIFPILKEFRKNNTQFVIFTLDLESTIHLKEKGYDVYDLSGELHYLLYKVLSRIYYLSEEEKRKIGKKIDLEYKEEIEKLRKNISLLEQDLGLDKSEIRVKSLKKIKTNKKSKVVQSIQNKPTYIENLYYFIANKHSKYSKYLVVRAAGKAAKPIFLKLEERAKTRMRLRELELKKEIERLKKIQLEKEQQITTEIKRLKKIQLEKEQQITTEKEVELIQLKIQLQEIELKKEGRIREIFSKIPITLYQKKLNEFIENVRQVSFDKDTIIEHLCRYFPNDTNVLYMARVIASISLFDRIFELFRFKSILVSSGGSPDIDMVCQVARKHNIPNYLMTIHPYEEYVPIHKVILNADKLLLAGDRLKRELQFLGIDEKRLIVTGNPKFDILNRKMEMKKTVTDDNNITNSKKSLIMVANSRWNDEDDMWMSELIRYCNNNNLEILIKVHPTYKYWKRELNDIMIQKIKEKCVGLKYDITIDADLSTLLSQASVLITEFSWTGFEGSLFDIPLIVTNFHGKNYSEYALLYHREGVALYASILTELFDCLNMILNDDKTKKKLKEGRKKLNYDFNYLNDGKAAERVFKLLTTGAI